MSTKESQGKPCTHLIEWDYKNGIQVDDDNDCVNITGMCDRCGRQFMKTYVDARYSVMDIKKNDDYTNEWENYNLIGTEEMAN